MPLWGCATATLSIFTARIGLTIDMGSVGKPSKGHAGGGGGAVVVGGGVVVVVVELVVVAGALLALPPPPHAVRTNRHATARPIQRRVLRGNVPCPLRATTAATRPLWRGTSGRGGMPARSQELCQAPGLEPEEAPPSTELRRVEEVERSREL